MGSCITPFQVTQKHSRDKVNVPCGKCPACLSRRVSAWSFRLMQEDKISDSSHFITLTYANKHVPITRNGFMGLVKRDLQLFFKRLRKAHEKTHHKAIRYYACGEYGTDTWRPHYHIIMFNAIIELIQPAWNMGQIHYGDVSEASVGYTLKYISKPKRVPLHRNDDRQPEFALMSKGLGKNYLTERMHAWHHADLDNRMYCNLTDGKVIAMPRYYKDKLYNEQQRARVAFLTRQKMLEREKQIWINGDPKQGLVDPMYYHNQAQAHLQAFRKINLDNKQKRNKL